MPDQNKPFVVTDRRKFNLDGEPRPDADPSPAREPRETTPIALTPDSSAPVTHPEHAASSQAAPSGEDEPEMPPPLTPEQIEQVRNAYQLTAERIETAIRAANPGMQHPPAMSFDQLVQSVYMTAIMQLGGGTPEGQQPQVDILGAKQSIDMLAVLAEKTSNNLSEPETRLLDNALFELRMAFLEITQSLARAGAANANVNPNPPGSPNPAAPGRPSIVR